MVYFMENPKKKWMTGYPHDFGNLQPMAFFRKSPKSSGLPSGKQPHSYRKSPFLTGTLTISMAIFNSYVSLPED